MVRAKKASPPKKKVAPKTKKGKPVKVEESVSSESEAPPSPAPASPAQEQSGAESGAEEPAVKKGRGRPASKTAKKATPTPKGKGKKATSPKRKSASKSKEPAAKAKGPAAKKAKVEASSGSEDDETEYEVERILEVQFLRNGKKEFLVQWKGFGKDGSTWEPEENLSDCKDLLEAFMAKLETSDLPRSRRVSTRISTVQSTRASIGRQKERVMAGRIGKSRSRSRVPGKSKQVLSLAEEVRRLNGEAAEKKNVRLVSLDKGSKGKGRSLGRAALLSTGMAVSIGAALLLSSSSTLNWDQVSQQLLLQLQYLREKLLH